MPDVSLTLAVSVYSFCTFWRQNNNVKAQITLNKPIADIRLRSRCAAHDNYLLVFIVEQNLVGIDATVSAIPLSPLRNTHDAPLGRLFENPTSSTKPEVRNVSQRRQRNTGPRPQATRVENSVNFGQTDRQMDKLTHTDVAHNSNKSSK